MEKNEIIEALSYMHKAALKDVEEFRQQLCDSDDPLYEMDWSEKSINSMAKLRVLKRAIALLEKHNVEAVIEQMQHCVLTDAYSPAKSSSAVSNLCKREELSVLAEVVQILKRLA